MVDFQKLRELPAVQVMLLEEYVRVAEEADAEARILLQLLDAGHMPTLSRHLKTKPLLNPYTIQFLAHLIEDRTHRYSGAKGADALHSQRNRPEKRRALEWFETVRGNMTKDDAAKEIARCFHKSERTARDWLKGV